ncbi:MAG: YkgJ family cysteine cluster protein [Pseudomonadota bacterium]
MTRQQPLKKMKGPENDATAPKAFCTRCGTCCKNGGPSIHMEDRELIEKGNIPLQYLFTIREHEPSFDNIKNMIKPAETDIVKIKSKINSHECIFHDPDLSGCRIYPDRPIECRILMCRDTKGILSIYDQNRISRKELLFKTSEIWDLVQHHHHRCSYRKIALLADRIKKNNPDASQEVNSMIQYDNSLRRLLVEKNEKLSGVLEFLLGRPLSQTISLFGLT